MLVLVTATLMFCKGETEFWGINLRDFRKLSLMVRRWATWG